MSDTPASAATAADRTDAPQTPAKSGKKKKDPLLPKIIRSTVVSLDATGRERELLERTHEAVHARAQEWSLVLLAMLGREVRLFDPARPKEDPYAVRDAAYWDARLVAHTGPLTAEQRESLREIAVGILKVSNRKGFLYRLRQVPPERAASPESQAPKGTPTSAAMDALIAAGVLPLKNLGDFDKTLDLAAWGVATGGLASWLDRDDETRANFRAARERVEKLAPDNKMLANLERFKQQTGTLDTDLTERLCDKVRRFGFDVFGWEEEFAVAKSLRKSVQAWLKVFEWSWESRRLLRLRPTATVRLPDATHSRRLMSFSENHVSFRASLDGDRLVFATRLWDGTKMVPAKLVARPTGYFRDLRVTEVVSKSNRFARFSYRRGNNSTMPEEVTADLKVLRVRATDAGFAANLPLSYDQPQSARGKAARDRYYNEPAGPGGLPEGLRVLAADMGTNLFWAGRFAEVRGGGVHLGESVTVGGVKDKPYHGRLRVLDDEVWACKQLIDLRKDMAGGRTDAGRRRELKYAQAFQQLRTDGITPESFRGGDDESRRVALQSVVCRIIREYDQLKRYDLYPSRQRGVCQEMFTWLKLTKNLHSLLKKWSYYRRPPAKLGERRPGFEARDRYYGNLKRDAAKKIAQALVAEARRLGADVIAIEDLDFGRKGGLDNEFLDIWAPAAIRGWVEHFAVQYGIWVAAVNPAHTSQLDPLTKRWGFRSKFERQYLCVERDGEIVKIHCDLDAAAVNILHRFLDRAANVFKMKVRQVAGEPGCYVPVLRDAVQNPKGQGWGRGELAHHLTRLYGTEWVIIRNGTAQPVSEAEFKAVDVGPKTADLYRVGDRWITADERKALVAAIQTRCESAASGIDIRPATLPPKPTRSRAKKKVAAA